MELIEKLQKIIEREIDNVPMVLTDPLTLRRLRAARLARAALAAINAEPVEALNMARDLIQDAEPVAWMREGPNTGLRVFFDTDPTRGGPATPLYTEAQMQARADAARREALEEAAGVVAGLEVPETGLGTVKAQAWCLAIDMGITAIRALKENHNAG